MHRSGGEGRRRAGETAWRRAASVRQAAHKVVGDGKDVRVLALELLDLLSEVHGGGGGGGGGGGLARARQRVLGHRRLVVLAEASLPLLDRFGGVEGAELAHQVVAVLFLVLRHHPLHRALGPAPLRRQPEHLRDPVREAGRAQLVDGLPRDEAELHQVVRHALVVLRLQVRDEL